MEVVLVAAVAENGVIGRHGSIPWHYPEDLRRFKETTTGHPVIMGRRTHESILDRLGEPLPDRTSIVLSRGDPDLPAGVVHAPSVEAALDAAEDAEGGDGTAYVVGGESVYGAFLPRADRLLITEIHEPYGGDTYFPDWDRGAWREVEREPRDEFDFVEYERRGRG